MTTIKASCPGCGDQELKPAQLSLVVCSRRPAWSYYTFACMNCGDAVRKPADPEIVALLKSGGVAVEQWDIPTEALEEHDGVPIAYDDILDFALSLDGVDLLAAMLDPKVGT
jgi:hypothetical protein